MTDSVATVPTRLSQFQIVLMVMLVVTGVGLRLFNLQATGTRTPDERNYTMEANILRQSGSEGFAILVAKFRQDPGLPSPARAGYLLLLARVMQMTGDETVTAGVWLSTVASIFSVLLLALLGWRFFSAPVALGALLLYDVSPMALVTARRCWEEALVEMLSLALLLLACEITVRAPRRMWMVLFALVGAFALTVKEVAAIAFVVCALAVLVVLLVRRQWRSAALFFGCCAVTGLVTLLWVAHLLGGVQTLWEFTRATTQTLSASVYSQQYEGGPATSLMEGFWSLSAATCLLALVAVPYVVADWRRADTARRIACALAAFCLVFVALAVFTPHHLNLRYVCPVFAPLCLLAGVGFSLVLAGVRRFVPEQESGVLASIVCVALLILAGRDYRHFRNDFAEAGVQDLSIRMVLAAGGIDTQQPAQPDASLQPPEAFANSQLTAAQWVNLSSQYAKDGRNQESIVAVRRALALEPDNAVAWNNLAAANENLQHWDEAIAAAQQALKLQPDFQLAKNNLAWSIEQKNKQAGK